MRNHVHDRYAQRWRALLEGRAARMRASGTASEARLWECLVNSKLGVPFRRQYVIGGRIVDFAAPSIRLVVEVDGGSHTGREKADARRERELGRWGYVVVRVGAGEVMRDLAGVVGRVREAVARAG